jgi:hypothetical protein
MGWFDNKDNKKGKMEPVASPELPELPELPSLPDMEENEERKEIHRLPSFPSNALGDKFSQNAIKEAVAGEEGDRVFDADEFVPSRMVGDMQMMPQKPMKIKQKMPMSGNMQKGFETRQYHYEEPEMQEIPSQFSEAARKVKRAEPLFIRIDKFEESLELFEKIKNKISEIDKMLLEIKQIKEDEEKEIISWEREIQVIKKQIEKIDEDIFSKIE